MATFGNTSVEASWRSIFNTAYGWTASPADGDGVANYIMADLKTWGSAKNVKGALHLNSDSSLVGTAPETSFNTADFTWCQLNFSGAPAVTNGTAYDISVDGNASGIDLAAAYSAGVGVTQSIAYGSYPPNPATWSTANWRPSIYVVYTPSVGGSPVPMVMNHLNMNIAHKIRGG